MKKFDQELVSGSILRSVWKLTWPAASLNLVNGIHGLVDHILIGHYIDSADNAGNAAIGVAWQVFLVFVVFIASLFHGMNVLIARYAGKQDRDNMSKVAYEAFLTAVFILLFVVAPVGYLIAPYLIDLVGASAEVESHALPYLRLLFTCGAPLFLMFMFTGAFQASGDPKTPLVLGILTTALNVCISVVLITGMGPFPALGTIGAGLGTVLAPFVSVIISIVLILRRKTILQPPSNFRLLPDLSVMKIVARIGIPTGIQGVLLNLGGFAIIIFIGTMDKSISAPTMAAYTICYAQLFSIITWTCFGLRSASGTLMGQNIGAGDPQRGKQAVRVAATLGAIWAIAIGSLFWLYPADLLALFGATEGPIVEIGTSLLRMLSFSGIVLAITLALTGGLQGAGETKLPMYIAFLTQILLLLGLCAFFKWQGTLTPYRIWVSIFISHFARLILTALVFRTEQWAHTKIEMSS